MSIAPAYHIEFSNQTRSDLYVGDALAVLKQLPDESVNCCITSPPYWGLRVYGTEPVIWGGIEDCPHVWSSPINPRAKNGAPRIRSRHDPNSWLEENSWCSACGAWCGSLGLEPTPELYVKHLVQVFRQVRRVLRSDGTLWLNLGDSYAGSYGGYTRRSSGWQPSATSIRRRAYVGTSFLPPTARTSTFGLKPRNLVGIPWRVALALQADGWILRSDIIWHKPNTIPESAKTRPSRAHEYVFLLAKSPRYFYDWQAVREPRQDARRKAIGLRNRRTVWTIPASSYGGAHTATFPLELIRPCVRAGCPTDGLILDPFAGTGTTGAVARDECRSFLGIELNTTYAHLARLRIGSSGQSDVRERAFSRVHK